MFWENGFCSKPFRHEKVGKKSNVIQTQLKRITLLDLELQLEW